MLLVSLGGQGFFLPPGRRRAVGKISNPEKKGTNKTLILSLLAARCARCACRNNVMSHQVEGYTDLPITRPGQGADGRVNSLQPRGSISDGC